MRQKPSTEHGLVEIDEPEGCIFEADKGVPVLVLITKLQSEQLGDKLIPSLPISKSGILSHYYSQPGKHCISWECILTDISLQQTEEGT